MCVARSEVEMDRHYRSTFLGLTSDIFHFHVVMSTLASHWKRESLQHWNSGESGSIGR